MYFKILNNNLSYIFEKYQGRIFSIFFHREYPASVLLLLDHYGSMSTSRPFEVTFKSEAHTNQNGLLWKCKYCVCVCVCVCNNFKKSPRRKSKEVGRSVKYSVSEKWQLPIGPNFLVNEN
jgi:hypothetical protein